MVLRGLSGYNTRWALKVLDRAMEGAAAAGGADPAAVTVFFGANDATLPDQSQAHQHVPLPEYQDNLRAICAYFKVAAIRTVLEQGMLLSFCLLLQLLIHGFGFAE